MNRRGQASRYPYSQPLIANGTNGSAAPKQSAMSIGTIVLAVVAALAAGAALGMAIYSTYKVNSGDFGDVKIGGMLDLTGAAGITDPEYFIPVAANVPTPSPTGAPTPAPTSARRRSALHKRTWSFFFHLPWNKQKILLEDTDVELHMPTNFRRYRNKLYTVYSNSDTTHVIVFDDSVNYPGDTDPTNYENELGKKCRSNTPVQVYWDKGRRYTSALFDAKAGCYIVFEVVDCYTLVVHESRGVKFCTDDLQTCDGTSAQIIEDLTLTGTLRIGDVDVTEFSKPPPRSITVGTPTPGLTSFPVNTGSRRRSVSVIPKGIDSKIEKHLHMLATRNLDAEIPVYPGPIIGGTFPYPGSEQCDTISCAINKLNGKVVNDTVVFVHPGVYEENVITTGFTSSCTSRSGQVRNGTTYTPTKCEGLILVGDPRTVVGQTYTHGTATRRLPTTLDLGLALTSFSFGGEVRLSCDDVQTVTVSTDFIEPNFAELGVVADDVVVMFEQATNTYHQRSVVSVVGNKITLDGAGCPFTTPGDGNTLTVMPNRIIRGVDGTNGSPPSSASAAVLGLEGNILAYGFWVQPPLVSTSSSPLNVFTLKGDATTNNMVIDGRARPVSVLEDFVATESSPSYLSENRESVHEVGFLPAPGILGLSGAITVMSNPSRTSYSTLISQSPGLYVDDFTQIGAAFKADLQSTSGFNALTITRGALPGFSLYVTRRSSVQVGWLYIFGGGHATAGNRNARQLYVEYSTMLSFDSFIGAGVASITKGDPAATECIRLADSSLTAFSGLLTIDDCRLKYSLRNIDTVSIRTIGAASLHSGLSFTPDQIDVLSDAGILEINGVRYLNVDSLTQSGNMSPVRSNNVITATSSITLTIPASFENFVGKSYTITSGSAHAHAIRLAAGTFAGTTNNEIVFNAQIGCTVQLKFMSDSIVFVETSICVTLQEYTFAPTTGVPTGVPTSV